MILVNKTWLDRFPHYMENFLSRGLSDNSPDTIHLAITRIKLKRPLLFYHLLELPANSYQVNCAWIHISKVTKVLSSSFTARDFSPLIRILCSQTEYLSFM